jgi:phosphoribosylpyrophosphate synthetase
MFLLCNLDRKRMSPEGFAHVSINDHIMELLILISACKMGSSKRITGNSLYETD